MQRKLKEYIIKSVNYVLSMNLNIPNYQRPYKWQNKNIIDLLEDIDTSTQEIKKYKDFKYRIGTVILHDKKENTNFDIIDGQQRLLSLALINYYLDNNFHSSLLNLKVKSKEAKKNIKKNYECISNWFSLKTDSYKTDFKNVLEKSLEVVVLFVDKLSSAFQLFDSQNTRGKALDPHDLLKAYHLREMQSEQYKMYQVVRKWESFNPLKIKNLFDVYLFPILNWCRKEKTQTFSVKFIDYYKGISENSDYTYAKRAKKAKLCFQITEPFTSGNGFFEMVSHYLTLLSEIECELENNEAFNDINKIIRSDHSVGFNYAVDLFKCSLLCYYDKFHNFDEQAIKKLFTWVFMLRVDMKNLGFESINKYASGDYVYWDKYTNHIPVFSIIKNVRFHNEISNLLIKINRASNQAEDKKWNELYKFIKKINVMEE